MGPVGDAGFVAPVHEAGHDGFVGAGGHVAAHVFLAVPGGHGPEGKAAVGEECAGLEALGLPDLAGCFKCVEGEEGQEAEGADAEAVRLMKGMGLSLLLVSLARRLGSGGRLWVQREKASGYCGGTGFVGVLRLRRTR